jgi:hypothetical protein
VVRYAFTVRDSHPLLLAGLPAHIGFVLPNEGFLRVPANSRSPRALLVLGGLPYGDLDRLLITMMKSPVGLGTYVPDE